MAQEPRYKNYRLSLLRLKSLMLELISYIVSKLLIWVTIQWVVHLIQRMQDDKSLNAGTLPQYDHDFSLTLNIIS